MGGEHWKTVGDLVTLQRGTTYSGKLVGALGPALLGLGSIEPGGGFRPDKYKTFGGEYPAKLMLSPGDIYVALKGATKDGSMVGSVARLPDNVPSGRLTQDTARLDFRDKDPETSKHLYWVLRTPQYRQYCEGRLTGSAAASFSREDFLSYQIPPINQTTRNMVSFFDAIEAKIELNRRMNATLEAMARALFQSWFVDFDPVRAKLDGRQPAGLDAATAALFPASFQDSLLGPIPLGWSVRGLDQIATYLNGLALQKFPPRDAPTLPAIKIAQLRKGDTVGADRCGAHVPSDYVINDGDVIFSWSGSLEVEVWCGGQGALNQHLFKVTSSVYPKWFYYLWTRHHLDEFRFIAADKATTMGHIQRRHLTDAKAIIPDRGLIEGMSRVLTPLIEQRIANSIQSRTLATLRNRLLPGLLNGAISPAVPEASSLFGVGKDGRAQ